MGSERGRMAEGVGYAYNVTGQRTNMVDASGTTAWLYDPRDRLTNKVVSFASGPNVMLSYRYNENGNLTNLWSDTTTGVTNFYQYDALSRLTNVLGRDSVSAGYTFDPIGNLQTVRYGSGVTNLYQYDRLNRLTNAIWKTSSASPTTVGIFYYKLGLSGMRTNLDETLNGTRSYIWQYDALYRLTNETINAAVVSYGYDAVGNRTNRTSGVSGLGNQNFTFNTNDWQNSSDSYDNNGNTTGSDGNTYQYDVLNRLTNVNSGTILIGYDGDGNRVRVTIKIHEIVQQLAYTSLFGDWRMLWIDEADAIPPVAQVRFLTLLDDLPRGVAVACTSNCKLRDFEERFQTRFQAFEIAPPTTEEIVSLLRRYLPDEPEIINAATFADGNVRQALLDAKGLAQRSLQLIAV